jgi:putative phage-type endonuclease
LPLIDAPQRSQDWLDARAGKITASLAAAILGVDKNKGPLAAYREIVGPHKDRSNRHTEWGVEFEASARSSYECDTGNLAIETGFWVHPTLPWLGASPDGLVNADGVLEVKCPQNIPTEVPPHHAVQMAVQMACTDREWADYYAWSQAGSFLFRLNRVREFEEGMLVRLKAWYEQYIVAGIEPPRSRSKGAAPS